MGSNMWNNLRSMDSVIIITITCITYIVHTLLPTTLDLEGVQGLAKSNKALNFTFFNGTRRYSLLSGLFSSSCREVRPSADVFFALQAKKRFFCVFAHFWCSVVTSVTFSSNHSKSQKIHKKIKVNPKNFIEIP